MKSPVLCFDLDGTLLDREGKIHPADVEILSARPKAWFVPITGRGLDSVKRMFNRNGLFVNQVIPFPMVLLNGAAIYLPGEELYSYTPFTPVVQRSLIGLAEDYPTPSYLFADDKEIYMRSSSGFIKPWLERFDLRPIDFSDGLHREAFCKVMIISDDTRELESIADFLETRHLERVVTLHNVLELTPPGVTKAAGVKTLTHLLCWDDRQILAAGDGENDLEVMQMARASFTTSSSSAKVMKRVDFVVDLQKEGLLTSMQEVGAN